LGTCSLPAEGVPGPCPALREREHEQDAHGEVLERVAEPAHDRVDGRSGAGARRVEPAEHDGERYEEQRDHEAREAHGRELPEVADPHLPGLVQAQQRQRYGAERRHHVELDRPCPGDDEGHHVGDHHDEPADERDDDHREERRHVVVLGHDRDGREVHGPARAEQRRHAGYREARDLVEGPHELERVLHEEEVHGEEHEQENDLPDGRDGGVAVHALGDVHELDREDHGEDPAADGQDGRLPGAARHLGERRSARRAEHRREGLGEHALHPYRREHPRLGGEDPVAGVAQDPAHPRVDVVGYRGEGRVRDEERDGEREPRGGGEPERPRPLCAAHG
jgi:hypothetical protein